MKPEPQVEITLHRFSLSVSVTNVPADTILLFCSPSSSLINNHTRTVLLKKDKTLILSRQLYKQLFG